MLPNVQASDLPIRVVSRRLVKASDDTIKPHVLALSHVDLQIGNLQSTINCVYPRPPPDAGGFADVVSTFEKKLPSFLNHIFPLTGRIATNPDSGILEVHCYNQGVEFTVAEVRDVMLGSMHWTDAEASIKKIQLPYPDDVIMSIQLFSFVCGGFAVVWGTNNLFCDGNFCMLLLQLWSQFVRTGGFAREMSLNLDRSVLSRPRSPPRYSDAVDKMFVPWDPDQEVNALTAQDSFVERLYYIEAGDIARLREEAGGDGRQTRATAVQAVSAYLWKHMASLVSSSTRIADESGRRCAMGFWVDGRWRVKSPELRAALRHYIGNVTCYVEAEENADAILRKPLADVAAMLRECITRVDYDEFLQDVVDWVEVHMIDNKQQDGQPGPTAAADYSEFLHEVTDWVEARSSKQEDGRIRYTEKAQLGLGTPTLHQTVWASFPCDVDFGFGQAAVVLNCTPNGRLCSAYLCVGRQPGGDAWIISAYIWPSLATALEQDQWRVFKPLTAEFLGLTGNEPPKLDRPRTRL